MRTLYRALVGIALLSPVLPAAELHRWTFNGDSTDSIGAANLTLQGDANIEKGCLILDGDGDWARVTSLAEDLGERTLVAWVSVADFGQAGGGVLTLTRPGSPEVFDGIVYGERVPRQWIAGSNSFIRTVPDNGGVPEDSRSSVMIAIAYGPGNTISLYRNGRLYSTNGATQGSLITYAASNTVIRLGERHTTTNANRFFAGAIDEARIYNTALSENEIAALYAEGATPDAGTPLHGTVLVTQLGAGNASSEISARLSPVTSAGVEYLPTLSNRGDYSLNFPFANDVASGVLIPTAAQLSRDNNLSPDVGGPAGQRHPTIGVAPTNAGGTQYFLAVFAAPSGVEMNANVSFAHFSFDHWLGASTESVGGALTLRGASAGLALGTHVVDQGNGNFPIDLRPLGGSATEGILLATPMRNDDNTTTVDSRADGTFFIRQRDNGANSAATEQDGIGFVFLPVADVGKNGLTALGRVNDDATVDVSGGRFVLTKSTRGTWELTIPGHSPDTGTLLISAEGRDGPNSQDNFVTSEWDPQRQLWTIASWDTPSTTTAVPTRQDMGSAELDAFSFAFISTKGTQARAAETGDLLTRNARARQSSTFPIAQPRRHDAGVAIYKDTPLSELTATNASDTEPYLEVELERPARVTSVEILNIQRPLTQTCCRSRLRDITITLYDRAGPGATVIATSPLLNPENSGFTFPDGPRSLIQRFTTDTPVGAVRISRTVDPDLSGSGGQGSPQDHEANLLEIHKVLIRGEFLNLPLTPPTVIEFDSRKGSPDPTDQGFYAEEAIIGNDLSSRNGFIDNGGNVGIVIDGTEATWQTNDYIGNNDRNLPYYRSRLSQDELDACYRLGWTFTTTFSHPAGSTRDGGFVGWGFSKTQDPGWGISSDFARIGFNMLNGPNNSMRAIATDGTEFDMTERGQTYTIKAVGAPGSRSYDWFVNDQRVSRVSFDNNIAGLTVDAVGFGSGTSNGTPVTNWKHVSLRMPEVTAVIPSEALELYLPFEPGSNGGQTFADRAAAPGSKPQVRVQITAGQSAETTPDGAVRAAAMISNATLDASDVVDVFADLDQVTLCTWLRTTQDEGTLFEFSDSGGSGQRASLIFSGTGNFRRITYASDEGSGPVELGTAAVALNDGRWHHIAFTLSPQRAAILIDGQLRQGSPSNLPVFLADLPTIDTLRLIQSMEADLDELMIWSRALTDEEIFDLYQRGVSGLAQENDADGDGFNAAEERRLGTSDVALDTDGDTISDVDEVLRRTNPSLRDSDGDGIDDNEELAAGTNPQERDSDGDGFDDRAEGEAEPPTNPLDPSSFPELIEPLIVDADNDSYSIYSEALLGTDPTVTGSAPSPSQPSSPGGGSADFFARSIIRESNGTIIFDFNARGTYENLRIQSSTGLNDFTDAPNAPIVNQGGDRFNTTFTPRAGHRFFRAVAETDGGTVSTNLADFSLPGGEDTVVRVEGSRVTLPVTFSRAVTGVLRYEVSGVDPSGELLPSSGGSVSVNGTSLATIELPLFDDLIIGQAARYTVTLLNSPDFTAGLAPTLTIIVEDNDTRWQGTMRVAEENLDFVLEQLQDSNEQITRLRAESTSSFFPKGSFAATVNFGPNDFSALAENITLSRLGDELISPAGGLSSLSLAAENGTAEDLVTEDLIRGRLTLSLMPPDGQPTSRSGTFNLLREPAPMPATQVNLQDTPSR